MLVAEETSVEAVRRLIARASSLRVNRTAG